MQQKQLKVGIEIDFVGASIIETGIPDVPKIISLVARGMVTQGQKLELLEKIEQHCQENPSHYLLIAHDGKASGFAELISQGWHKENTLGFFVITTNTFRPLHQQNSEKLESLESDIFEEIRFVA